MIWHNSSVQEVLNELKTDKDSGLSNGTATERISEYGKNIINNENKKFFLKEFLKQLNNRFVYILFAVAIISFAFSVYYKSNDIFSPLLIIAIVILNALISAFFQSRGRSALERLKSATDPKVNVLRDGIKKSVYSSELVPGDILLLEEGDYIAADARIIESVSLRCNQQKITGDSIPADKTADELFPDITPIAQRKNMLYSGTNVIHGSAKAVVVETGINTETGRSDSLERQSAKTSIPLQDSLLYTGKTANIIILIICSIVFVIEFLFTINSSPGEGFAYLTIKTFLNSAALAVAAIPEGLPAIAAITVALSLERLVKNGIIVKKIKALEKLGDISVLCADKTGILTHNSMTAVKIFNGNETTILKNSEINAKSSMVLKLAAACSTLENDPTESAIEKACNEINNETKTDIEAIYPRLCTIPFDSDRKTMTSVNMINGQPVAITKGAPEIIAEICGNIGAEEILKENEKFAEDSLRVVGIAIKQLPEIPANPNADEIETDMIFVGLIGLEDPPRSDAVQSIGELTNAGIKTLMITGDNITTAKAVARRIGILKDGTIAVTGAEIDALSDEELYERIGDISVFARISSDQKLRIVKALKKKGECVAVTGDSISDSTVLTKADIGCVMGNNGSDVAKGSADIIDEHFDLSSLLSAIKESSSIFANIQKCVRYLLSCNFAEIFIYLIGLLAFRFPPLSCVQLLWINLLTDCTPAISLSMEYESGKIGKDSKQRLFNKNFLIKIMTDMLFITVLSFISYKIGLGGGKDYASAMLFLTLGLVQIIHSYCLRSSKSIFKLSPVSNEFMLLTSLLAVFILVFLCVTPAGAVFGLEILKFKDLIIAAALALVIVPYNEILKIAVK